MTDQFKMAIIGTGNIAAQMAKTINGMEETEAYAVASRDVVRAQQFAEKWNFTKYYGSYEEMAADPDIDLVYVATPHSEHYENARLFLEHGKNVLVEKSFTANARQAKELIDLARENRLLLAEAMWTRYMPGLQMINRLIADGRIGQVDSVEADFSYPISHQKRMYDPALAGGALLDLGVYVLTFASMFLGDDIVSVRSRCIRYATGVDATDWIDLTYRDGRQAFLRTSMVSGPGDQGRINGTQGYILVSGIPAFDNIQLYDASGQLQETLIPPKTVTGYEYEVLACIRAIKAGLPECAEMPHAETLTIMEQMDELRRAWGIVYPFE